MENKEIWFMRQAGRYLTEYKKVREKAGGFFNLCFNPEQAAEVTLQPIRRFDFDTAIIFSDILTIPIGFGRKTEIIENQGGPKVEQLVTPEEIIQLQDFELEKLNKVLEAIKLTREILPKNKRLIGFCGAPWTLAVYMLQGKSSNHNEITHRYAYKHPEAFGILIEKLSNAVSAYLCAQISAGCDTVQLFDSWASFLSEENFLQFVVEPSKKIIKNVKEKHPEVRFIHFPRGAGMQYQNKTNFTADIIGCDTSLTVRDMQSLQETGFGVQGNLDPNLLLVGGDLLKKQTLKLKKLHKSGKYIFNLGHGIFPETPIKHVENVIEWFRNGE